MIRAIVVMVLGSGGLAQAREPSTPTEWVDVGPIGVGGLTGAAVHPVLAGSWAVVTGDGAVEVTVDAGAHWRSVLGPVDGEREALALASRLADRAPDRELPDLSSDELGEDELAEVLEAAVADAEAEARQGIEALRSEVEPLRRPLERPRIAFDGTGALVVTRADGAWRSSDLGSVWLQTREEPVEAWTALGAGPEIAGDGSALLRLADGRLERCTPVSDPGPEDGVRTEAGDEIPLGALIDAAVARSGPRLARGRRLATVLIPELVLDAGWSRSEADLHLADASRVREVGTAVGVEVRLTWSAGRTPEPFDPFDPVEVPELVVIEGEIAIEDDAELWPLASRVARSATQHGTEVAQVVGRLVLARQRLVRGSAPDEGPLVDRVRRALDLAELDARLDALTGLGWGGEVSDGPAKQGRSR